MSSHRFLIVAVITVCTSAHADIIYVDDDNCPGPGDGSELDPYCSIQTAIDNAVDTDEIIVAPGTYFEQIDFIGKAVWLHSSDGPDLTTIHGTVVCDNIWEAGTIIDGLTIVSESWAISISNTVPSTSPTVSDCMLTGKLGAISNDWGSPLVTNCVFTGQVHDTDGGSVIINCVFSNIPGDAFIHDVETDLYIGGTFPRLINCLFVNNDGFGVYNNAGHVELVNCTFRGNATGAIRNDWCEMFGNLSATNCVLWENAVEVDGCGATFVQYSLVQGGYPGTGNIDADPLFVDPDNDDWRLQANSPCIDAGRNDDDSPCVVIVQDLDGNERLADDPDTPDCQQAPGTCGDAPVVDMGAYEFNSPPADAQDCNGNMIPDAFELASGGAPDCNANCVPDSCDIADGTSDDETGDGVPDECQPPFCLWDCANPTDWDGQVDAADFIALMVQWSMVGSSCDFDGGGVGVTDFLELLAHWGPCP